MNPYVINALCILLGFALCVVLIRDEAKHREAGIPVGSPEEDLRMAYQHLRGGMRCMTEQDESTLRDARDFERDVYAVRPKLSQVVNEWAEVSHVS